MSYLDIVRSNGANAEQLEKTYQQALAAGESAAFTEAVNARYGDEPDNLLYAAWYYRMAYAATAVQERVIAWSWAIPLALVNGLLLWLLSDEERFMVSVAGENVVPLVILLWAPICAVFVMAYLAPAASGRWQRIGAITAGLAVLCAYVLLTYTYTGLPVFQKQYLNLMIPHLPLLAWTGVGLYLLLGHGDAENRFAFLLKSLEVMIMAGLFVIAGAAFIAITVGLFETLDTNLPNLVMRLFIAGGGGLIPVLAAGIIYDPTVEPREQAFGEGLSHLMALLMRLLLLLSLLVMVVFLAFVPFNFREPFRNRDVLIVYNAMLFAVMALLVGATPAQVGGLGRRQQLWLRRGIIALAGLAIVAGLYALIAIGYRTWQGTLTPNRMVFMGWNLINIGVLALLLIKQARAGSDRWLPPLQSAFATGMAVYVAWTLVAILAVPWLFGIGQGNLADVPEQIQPYVLEGTFPILLKCTSSPHIYLLANGEKRWVKDIATFEAEGFEWDDVRFVPCDTLRSLPDGPPIPRNAGAPPTP